MLMVKVVLCFTPPQINLTSSKILLCFVHHLKSQKYIFKFNVITCTLIVYTDRVPTRSRKYICVQHDKEKTQN